MCDTTSSDKTNSSNSVIHPLASIGNNRNEECETAEEAVTSDSEEYLSESLR